MERYYVLTYDPSAEYRYAQAYLDCVTTNDPGDLTEIVAQAVGVPGKHLVSVRVEVTVLQSKLTETPDQPPANGNGTYAEGQSLEVLN